MITRRQLLKTSTAAGLGMAASGLAAPAIAQGAKIKLGYVSPQSGALAAFSEADAYILQGFANSEAGANFEVIVKDSQSNPNRAADVAGELIVDDGIDMMLVASTPETTNPVTTTCEAEEVPCLSTVAPWQPWFIGQQGNPGDPASWERFYYSYHFFWGLEDFVTALSFFTAKKLIQINCKTNNHKQSLNPVIIYAMKEVMRNNLCCLEYIVCFLLNVDRIC